MDIDPKFFTCALDFYSADSCVWKFSLQEIPDLPIFNDVVLVLLIGVPTGLPVCRNTKTEAVRVNFLTHDQASLSSFSGVSASAEA